jgi:ferritin-like metal-binding protein YciE
MKTGEDLVLHFLKDMYYAEKALLKLFPEVAAAAKSHALKIALEKHTEETKTQLTRLEGVFRSLGRPVEAMTCEAMVGMIQETDDVLKESGGPSAIRDAALAACVKAIEHYEIARYGSIAGWLEVMGHVDAAKSLRQSIQEDSGLDALLSETITNSLTGA